MRCWSLDELAGVTETSFLYLRQSYCDAMFVSGKFRHLKDFQYAIKIMVASYTPCILAEMGIVETVNLASLSG